MSKEEIKAKIKSLEEEKKNAKGTECSVYSRIVGYLRPVANWNDGKKEEFKLRKMYHRSAGVSK